MSHLTKQERCKIENLLNARVSPGEISLNPEKARQQSGKKSANIVMKTKKHKKGRRTSVRKGNRVS